jgi:AcrR family transcriptional regulator
VHDSGAGRRPVPGACCRAPAPAAVPAREMAGKGGFMIDAWKRGADPEQGGSGDASGGSAAPEPPEPIGPREPIGPKKGRGGARRERRERTRTALFASAQRLWAERGIHGASLDDIAADAGLTKGAVYSNFSGKTDLLLALLERWTGAGIGTEDGAELLSAARPGDHLGIGGDRGSPEERFERAGRAYARRIADENARLLVLLLVEFWLYGMRDRAAGRRIAGWYAERRASLAEGLCDVDDIPAGDRATLAGALDFGLAMQHLLDPERVPAELYGQGMRLLLGKALA